MIALSISKLKILRQKAKCSCYKAKMDQFRSLEVREKVRNVFVKSLRLSYH